MTFVRAIASLDGDLITFLLYECDSAAYYCLLPPPLPPPMQYMITEHGQVSGEDKMIAEMYTRGPIACTIAVTKGFEMYTGGVFNDTTGAKVCNNN